MDNGAATIIPRVLEGAVSGVEIVAVGALQFTRDVLLSAVSGAASIGAEALSATTAGARGVVSAASRMVADIADSAQASFRDAVNNARRPRRRAALMVPRKPTARASAGEMDSVPSGASHTRRRIKSEGRPVVRAVSTAA